MACEQDAHVGLTCEQVKNGEDNERRLIQNLVAAGEDGRYGKCPQCEILIEKKDGCQDMVCGDNASDKNQLPSRLRKGRGCGHHFKWHHRIQLRKWLDDHESS